MNAESSRRRCTGRTSSTPCGSARLVPRRSWALSTALRCCTITLPSIEGQTTTTQTPPLSTIPGMSLDRQDGPMWREAIHELASFERPSASEGERRAAQWIALRLQELGCRATVEEERAHGGYWWPIGLANLLAVAGAVLSLRRRGRLARSLAALAGGLSAAALWDDLGHGRRWFRRALLPHRPTWNVVAETGDAGASRTLVLVAHHDAAHSGLVFHPALGQIGPRFAPRMHERSAHTVPILHGVWLGPLLVWAGAVLGARVLLRAGVALGLGASAAMADIGLRPAVPGANDNLAAVGVLIALAESLREQPIEGLRVL